MCYIFELNRENWAIKFLDINNDMHTYHWSALPVERKETFIDINGNNIWNRIRTKLPLSPGELKRLFNLRENGFAKKKLSSKIPKNIIVGYDGFEINI